MLYQKVEQSHLELAIQFHCPYLLEHQAQNHYLQILQFQIFTLVLFLSINIIIILY